MDLKKQVGVVAASLVFVTVAVAQEAAPVQVAPQQPAQVVIIQESAPAPAVAQALPEAAPVQAAPQAVIVQPTTLVEDTPLVESKAEALRRNRQKAEVETEQKIVEKLEESRLDDEKKRMDALFGDKLDKKQEEVAAPAVVAPVEAPVVVAPVEEKKEEINTDQLKAEIAESVKADLNAIKAEEKKAKPEFKKRMVISAGLGTIDYEVGQIDSDFVGGFSLGYEFRERMELEGAFYASQHTAIEPSGFGTVNVRDMDQYNMSVGLRYAVLPYFISPVVGALASYTHRQYTIPFSGFDNEVKSDALDVGFLVGVDVLLSKNMSVTFDYRRFMNIESRVQDNALLSLRSDDTFEESDYDMLNLALRFMF